MQTNCAFPERPEPTNRRPRLISHVTIPMIVAAFVLGFGVCANAQTATIDFSSPVNTTTKIPWITGFGAGTKYYAYAWGPLPQAVFNTLYCNDGTTDELGLNLLRINIDPAGENYYAPMNVSPYLDGYGWDGEKSYAYQAEQCGAMVMASVTAPYCLQDGNANDCYTTNGNVFDKSAPGPYSFLELSDYGNFGTWLESYINYLANPPNPVTLTGISLEDEPSNPQSAFGDTDWTADEFDSWLAGGYGAPITNTGTRIFFPEQADFAANVADTALADNNANKYVGAVIGHCYGGVQPLDTHATILGLPEWMTECNASGGDHPQNWGEALGAAESVAGWMGAGYNAWMEWNALDNYHPTGVKDGLVNITSCGTTTCAITPIGYAVGQYSEFARPGYMSNKVTLSGDAGVSVTAYQGGGFFVIVAVNSTASIVDQTFDITGFTVTPSSFAVTQSTDSTLTDTACGSGAGFITCQQPGSPSTASVISGSPDYFTYNLPKYSVVTFVGKGTGTANMMANPTWATGDMAGWSEFIGTGSASDFSIIRDGTGYNGDPYYLKEHDANSFNLSAHQKIQNQPVGDDIKFTIYVKSTNNHGYIQVLSGTTSLCEVNIPNNNSTWTQYSCTGGTVPASGLFVVVAGVNNAAAGDSYEFDSGALTVTTP